MGKKTVYKQTEFDTGVITFGVRGIKVWQGDPESPFADVQASGQVFRDPRLRHPTPAMEQKEIEYALGKYSQRIGKDEKWCSACGDVKQKTEFKARKGTPDGLQYQCKACEAIAWRKRYAEKVLEFEGRVIEERPNAQKYKAA